MALRPVQQSVEAECGACRGTGIYQGFAEPKGVGIICLNCGGEGKKIITYTPFAGRKGRNDIRVVRRSAGSFLATGVDPTGGSVTYEEFISGKMPG
jgi:hypothetical protein